MIIGACTITLQLYGLRSLKEKRSIVKSVLARMRSKFNVAAAEVDARITTAGRCLAWSASRPAASTPEASSMR